MKGNKMQKSDLIFDINRDTIPDLIPIELVKTEKDKCRYQEKGYNAQYTKSEFQTTFPSLDTTKIFYSPCFVDGIIYYDAEKYIFLDTHIIGTDVWASSYEEAAENIQKRVIICEQFYSEKDYCKLLINLRDGVMLHFLNEIITTNPATGKMYDLFYNLYMQADYGFHSLGVDTIKEIVSAKTQRQTKRTQNAIKNLPDIITIYRGEADKSTPWQKSYSWTTDINTAYFFAVRLGIKSFKIHTAKIRKENVIEYFTERNEDEIFCLPENVFEVSTLHLPPVKELVSKSRFLNYYWNIDGDIQNLNDSLSGHDSDHTRRVAILAGLLCDKEGKNLPSEMVAKLFRAIAYHDAGRIDDEEDEAHGGKGYIKYLQHHQKDDIVKFLTVYHSIDDSIALKAAKEEFPNGFKLVWKLFCILKDADALDRVRFGLRDVDGLNVNYLRLPYSKQLVAAAEQLLHSKLTL